jgi:hypothetical protein
MLDSRQIEELRVQLQEVGLDLSQERAKTRLAYKEPEAREQFVRLLINCKLFSKIENEEDRIKHNLALSVLQDMGFLDETNIVSLIDFLFTLPMIGKRED